MANKTIPQLPDGNDPDNDNDTFFEAVQVGASVKLSAEQVARTADGLRIETGTAYTLAVEDQWVFCNNANPFTLTVPLNATVPIPVGRGFNIVWYGVGAVTIAAAGGVTIRTPDTLVLNKRYATVTVFKLATNEWILAGYLQP